MPFITKEFSREIMERSRLGRLGKNLLKKKTEEKHNLYVK